MNKTYGTMKSNVGNVIQDNSATTISNIGVWINNRYEDIIRTYNWEELYDTYTFTASANTSDYGLDDNSSEVVYVFDTNNNLYLTQVSIQDVYANRESEISMTSSRSDCYIPTRSPVKKQISSAQKPIINSSSASDTTQSVLIRGIVSGYEVYESLNLSGTTSVTASGSFSKIFGISKSAVTSGYITLLENDETTSLATMPQEVLESRYVGIKLFPTPSNENVYRIGKKRRVSPLSQAYDYPAVDCSTALEYGAMADAWRAKRQFSKASVYEAIYEQEKSKLVMSRLSSPNEVLQMRAVPLNRDEGI